MQGPQKPEAHEFPTKVRCNRVTRPSVGGSRQGMRLKLRSSRVPSIDHFIITRFNLPIAGCHPTEDWMRERVQLFEQVCLPSFEKQVEPRFSWLVFFDSATSEDWVRRISQWPLVTPVFIDAEFSASVAVEHVRERARTATVITTRVDNDDAIAPSFVRMIHSKAARFAGFIDFPLGYQAKGPDVFLRVTRGSPFLSRVERVDDLATVYAAPHWKPPHPLRRVSRPGWLQMIHDSNLANEIRRSVKLPRSIVPSWVSDLTC